MFLSYLFISLIKTKNKFINFYYNFLEKNRILITNDFFYYLWKINLYFNVTLNKKMNVSYIYDSTKYSTLYYPKNYAHLNFLHNNLITKCESCNDTFGRKKTYIHSIVDNYGNDYKYILKLLPQKKYLLNFTHASFLLTNAKV